MSCLPKRRKKYIYKKSKPKSEGKAKNGRWSTLEHLKFLEALKRFGKNWREIEKFIGSRTSTQARSHAQKFFANIEKEDQDLETFLSSFSLEELDDLKIRVT